MPYEEPNKRPRKFSRSNLTYLWRYLPLVFMLCFGGVLSLLLFSLVNKLEQSMLRAEFRRKASQKISLVNQALEEKVTLLESVRSFCSVSKDMDREAFQKFVTPLISDVEDIRAVGWIPRVSDSEREAYEKAAQSQGLTDFHVTERTPQGDIVPASSRGEYFPVYYMEPYDGNEVALGFDMASEQERKATLEQARITGNILATPILKPVQEKEAWAGFLIFLPVYRNGVSADQSERRDEDLLGYVMGTFIVGEIVKGALAHVPSSGVDLMLYDGLPSSGKEILHTDSSSVHVYSIQEPVISQRSSDELSRVEILNVAGRPWAAVCRPATSFYAHANRRLLAGSVLGASLAFTILLTLFVGLRLHRGVRIERMANDLKQAQRALRLTQFAVDTAGDAVFWLRPDGSFFYVNDTACHLAGYARNELLRMRAGDLNLAHTNGTWDAHWADLKKKKSVTFETCFQTKDNHSIPVELTANYIKYEGGEYNCAFARDISERKVQDQKRRSLQSQIELILHSTNSAINILDSDLNVVYVSSRYKELYGDSSGMKCYRYFHDREDVCPECDIQDVLHKKEMVVRELQPNSESVWEVKMLPFQNEQDEWMVAELHTDITPRKQVEEALRESEQRFRTMMEQAPYAIQIMDVDGQIVEVNNACLELWGITREELPLIRGQYNIRKDAQMARLGLTSHIERAFAGETVSLPTFEYDPEKIGNAYIKGEKRWVRSNIYPVKTRSGEIRNVVMIQWDVTHHKRMEEEKAQLETQLRQSQKMESIGTLASGVAHEINNPVNGITNYAQLIADRLSADSPLQEFASEIMKEADRVTVIVRNLLAFARNERQTHSAARIKDIMDATLSLIRTVMRHDNIILEVDVPEDLPKIDCRSQQVEQVLMNLLTNSRDALNERYPGADPNKILRVTAREIDRDGRRWVRTTVEDRGAGIPPEIMTRLFDPFFTTKLPGKGTGLGLSISHGIIKDHHGEMFVESDAGESTSIHVDLPVDSEFVVSIPAESPLGGVQL